MSNTHTVAAMIRDHGNRAFPTPNGLLALGHVRFVEPPLREMEEDRDFDELMVFEHDADGNVSLPAVRRWLGY